MERMQHPRIAIVDPNTLAVLGLTHLLESVMPMICVDAFGSFAELEANHPERFFHYFVDVRIVLSHMDFFRRHSHKTIVLSNTMMSETSSLGAFHTICVDQPEKQLLRSLLVLEQYAHANGRNLPDMQTGHNSGHNGGAPAGHGRPAVPQKDTEGGRAPLTPREIEVMSLVVRGYINKEIASRLSLSMATVVSHRKNLMSKLGIKSVSALTIYAVMHGYVEVGDI